MNSRVLLGAVIGAHGIKGEVKVKAFTEHPENLGAYGPLATEEGRELKIAHLRPAKGDQLIVSFAGIEDRNAAEALKGEQLYVPRAALPAPEKGEYYLTDLIGLRAEDKSGVVLGTVSGVHNFGAGDVIEIVDEENESTFLPFTDESVPVVDIEGGRIVATPPDYSEEDG